MHVVALAWMFVVVLMAAAEATSPVGTVLGALVTLTLYGLLPLSIVLYVMGGPARRRARRAAEAAEAAADHGGEEQREALSTGATADREPTAEPPAASDPRP